MTKRITTKASILSVSMMVGTIAAINGNISQIALSFPDVPVSTVELISTIPSLFLIASVLTSTWIAQRLGMKRTVLAGVLLAAVAGVAPFFLQDIALILASRALLGFGTGLFNSLLVTFISSLFDGEECTEMIGRHQAMGAGGGIIVTFVSGQLLQFGWQWSFLAYAIGFVSFLLFMLFVSDVAAPNDVRASLETSTDGGNASIASVIPWLALIFLTAVCYMTFGVKISALIAEGGYGSPIVGSYVIMGLCLGSLIAGFLFARMLRVLKNRILLFGFSVLALSMLLLAVSKSSALTVFGGFLAGFGNAGTIPFVLNNINSSGMKKAALASSLVYVAFNLGSFISPYGAIVIQALSPFPGMSGLFIMLAILWVVFAALSLTMVRGVGKAEE